MLLSWEEISRANDAEIIAWAEAQPWARAMSACQQDKGWHAEGDVWTHTKMVAGALHGIDEWNSLDRDAQLKLIFTALLHDSGKPATTAFDEESGRVRSPKHAIVGAELARRVLRELRCPVAAREEIVAMVRYHGRPPYLLEKESPEREVISLSWVLNNRLLFLFALADTRGRLSFDTSRPEETLHLWKLLCEENGCFTQPYRFANDHARFLFYRDRLSSLHYTPHEDFRCRVALMSGLPGAGKDTWLAIKKPNLPIVSLDAVRAELDVDPTDNQGTVIQEAREQCRRYLRAGTDFAFNATNTSKLTRSRWIDLFADYGARIEIVYIEPPTEVLFEQNRNRSNVVPTSVILRLLESLEPPTWAEAHSVAFVESVLASL